MLVFVDLDGTLIATDVSAESALGYLRDSACSFLCSFPLLLKGRSYFKAKAAATVEIDPASLPYRAHVIEYLKKRKAEGDTLVLLTASHQKYADQISAHLGIFDAAYGSSESRNLKGAEKVKFIKEKYPDQQYSYLGDSHSDKPVWAASTLPVVVAIEESYTAKALKKSRPETVHLAHKSPTLDEYFAPVRPHQWSKNLLLFVPAILAHKIPGGDETSSIVLFQLLVAFLSFSLCSSAIYVFNDLLDIANDRKHPTKRTRPFASGSLPPFWGLILMLILLAGSSMLSSTQMPDFVLVLDTYLVATLLYSIKLKRVPMLDIVLLAGLYTLRIIAGGIVARVEVSQWLKALSMFLFLSLACVKRASELLTLKAVNQEHASGRAYRSSDLDLVIPVGVASGLISTLVLALYISSSQGGKLYTHPERLWWVCPILLFGLLRTWFLTRRGEMNDDPVVFALKDPMSYLLIAFSILSMYSAI